MSVTVSASDFAGELVDCQVADMAPGLCHELLNRTGHDRSFRCVCRIQQRGLINWSANQCAGQRMRGLELDSAFVTERFPSNEDGPVTDLRRCATG